MFPFARRAGALRPSEILDLLPEAVVLFDRRGRCTHANGLALARWGSDGLSRRTAAEIFSGRDEEIARTVAAALESGPAPAQVARFVRAEGELRVLRVRGGALVIGRSGGSEPAPAAPAAALPGELARRLSHDLVQPLSSISNYAELIRGTTTGDTRQYAERIAAIARKAADALRGAVGDGDKAARGSA